MVPVAAAADDVRKATARSGCPVTRRGVLGAGAALLVAGVGARIWRVNAEAPVTPEKIRHAMGEWVDLDGAFVDGAAYDRTEGYHVRISQAELLSYNEYVRRYSKEGDPETALYPVVEGLDAKSLVTLTFDIRNDDSDGCVIINEMYLIPARRNEFFRADIDLLTASEEKLVTGATSMYGVSIRQGTEHTIHLAYGHQGGDATVGGRVVKERWVTPIVDTRFELILSYMPVRHVVDIELA